jgi:putative membrane protein
MLKSALLAIASAAMIHSAQAGSPADDTTFLKTAIGIDLAEIDVGKLAQTNGKSEMVKQFGAMLVTDHSKDRDQLIGMAQKASVQIPSAPSPEDQAKAKRLSGLSGAAFDKAFGEEMVKGHKAAIAFYSDKAADTTSTLASYAKATIPVLQRHLEEAAKIAGQNP